MCNLQFLFILLHFALILIFAFFFVKILCCVPEIHLDLMTWNNLNHELHLLLEGLLLVDRAHRKVSELVLNKIAWNLFFNLFYQVLKKLTDSVINNLCYLQIQICFWAGYGHFKFLNTVEHHELFENVFLMLILNLQLYFFKEI